MISQLLMKFPEYSMTKLLDTIGPKIKRFRHRYTNRITGKIIFEGWDNSPKYYSPSTKRFGIFAFLWKSNTEFEYEKENEVFSWSILQR